MTTDTDRLRSLLADPVRVAESLGYGDGLTVFYPLPYNNPRSGSAFVMQAGAWSATGATVNPTGYLEFQTVLPTASAWRARYQWSIWGDDELSGLLSAAGSVFGAALQAAYGLLIDGSRRARWMAPDRTTYDDVQAVAYVNDFISAINKERENQAAGAGGLIGWSDNQPYQSGSFPWGGWT